MSEVELLMKRCQRGVGGFGALNEAHDIMAECYGMLGKLSGERDAALAECERLRGLLAEARELISRGDFDTSVCCCGGDVDKHGFGDGHSPVDEGGYYALGVMQRIDAALSAKP